MEADALPRPASPSPGSGAGAPSTPVRFLRPAVVALLLLLHLVLANVASWSKSPTFDEPAHIGNGFSYRDTGDYRMAPDSILAQRWMTLPIYLLGYKGPPTEGASWWRSDNWAYARTLLYEMGNDQDAMLHVARFVNSLWNVAVGGIVYAWAARLFGAAGGFVALIAYLFNPTVLAHGSSATIDAAATFAFTASIAALWSVLHAITPRTAAVSCLAVGCAFVTKFSLLLLIPIGLLMAAFRIAGRRPLPVRGFGREYTAHSWWEQALLVIGLIVLHVVAAWCIIWTMFGFRYEMMLNAVPGRDTLYTGDWDAVLASAAQPLRPEDTARNGLPLSFVTMAREHQWLPEAYLYNFAASLATTSIRSSFLNGRYGVLGFASFFPYCLLYKTPLAVFLLLLAGIAAHVVRRIRQLRDRRRSPLRLFWDGFYATSPLWSLLLVYWFVSMTRGINIGVRHILPTFPAMFILAGAAGAWLYGLRRTAFVSTSTSGDADDSPNQADGGIVPNKPMQCVVAALLAWLVLDVLWAFPNYLA
jgi:hypothetical protein